MSNNSYLALLLDGPMQSWGYTSRFTRRTTALHPTKSGVVGLLAAGLGINKHAPDEPAQIARLAELQCTTITLPKKTHQHPLPILRLNDYHTIGGGYEKATDWMKKPRAASGATLDTILSERHYLLDARFGILLQGPTPLLTQIAAALQNPRWGLWLGRKCCIPATPILVGTAPDFPTAWQHLLKAARLDETATLDQFDHTLEGPAAEGLDAEWLNDTPHAYGAPIGQRHTPRRIRRIPRQNTP